MSIKENIEEILDNLGNRELEYFISDLFSSYGWETEVTPQSGDLGIDVIARKKQPLDIKILIQAKNYTTQIERNELKQYAALQLQEENVSEVAVITTAEITDRLVQIADDVQVQLLGKWELISCVQNTNLDFLEQYGETDVSNDRSEGIKTERTPGLYSNVKITAESDSLIVRLLGFTKINITSLSSDFTTSTPEYQPSAFLKLYNKSDEGVVWSPNNLKLVDSEGYMMEPAWGSSPDLEELPAKWLVGKLAVDPNERAKVIVTFQSLPDDTNIAKLRHTMRLRSMEGHGRKREKIVIDIPQSRISDLRGVSFVSSDGKEMSQ